jgi:predicted DNA-binding transcriptional regulator YafY
MRRADRLFQIIQILRRATRPITASALADEIEVSKRTVYRDIADLIGQRVPIEGAAGLGYLIDPEYDMPPLMLTVEELEAVALGAQLVANLPDAALANAARDVVAKIASVVPDRLRPFVLETSLVARPIEAATPGVDTRSLRLAIRENRKIQLRYQSQGSDVTTRTVWPVILGYAESHCLLIAWCELRNGFRHFRTERMIDLAILDEPCGAPRTELRRRWERWRAKERSARAL